MAKEYYDNSGISTAGIPYFMTPVYPQYDTNYPPVDKKDIAEELHKLNERLDRIATILEEIKKELK